MIPIYDIHDFGNVKTVSIETKDLCNRKCYWCPNKDRHQEGAEMDEETYDKILSELKARGYNGQVHPYFRNEPLMDIRIHQLIRKTRNALPDAVIRINTNGDFLKSSESVEILLAAGCDSIHISHYSEKHRKLGKVADKYYPQITHFGLDYLISSFYNRGGNVDVRSAKQYQICPWLFQKVMIVSNGNAVLCCSDFHEQVVLGNAKDMTVEELWNSPTARKYREYHAEGRAKELPLCDKCNFIE